MIISSIAQVKVRIQMSCGKEAIVAFDLDLFRRTS